ncbi:hypothetical protein CCP2SC5_520004 [Azospirillaceae bacterium]
MIDGRVGRIRSGVQTGGADAQTSAVGDSVVGLRLRRDDEPETIVELSHALIAATILADRASLEEGVAAHQDLELSIRNVSGVGGTDTIRKSGNGAAGQKKTLHDFASIILASVQLSSFLSNPS